MQVVNHPDAGLLLTFEATDPEHEPVLQRMARRVKDGSNNCVTVFRQETVNLLSRMGYHAPLIEDHYVFRGKWKPFPHQITTAKFLFNTYRGWCLNGMRSGKTTAAGYADDMCRQFGEGRRTLVVAPLSILETSWGRELFYINPTTKIYVANRSIQHMKDYAEQHGVPDIIVINPGKLRFIKNWLHKYFDPHRLIVDESTAFNNPDNDCTGAFELLASKRRRIWLLSGTPATNGPEDVWSLSRFVNPATPSTKNQWRDKTMIAINQRTWVPRLGHEEMVAELLQPAIRFATADCIDMPEQTYSDLNVDMTKDQTVAYKDMLNTMRLEYGNKTVVAANAAVRVFKLLQVCAGIVLDNDGIPVVIGAQPRVKECLRIINESEGKTIIVCPFTEPQEYIAAELRKKGLKVDVVNGTVTGLARTAIFDRFQNGDTDVLVAHPMVIQFGLTLSAASSLIWWTMTFSTLQYLQANERPRGPNTGGTGVYHLLGTALEKRIVKQLTTNSITNDRIVDFFRQVIDDKPNQITG